MKRTDKQNKLIAWVSVILAVALCITGICACAASQGAAADGSRQEDGSSVVTPIEDTADSKEEPASAEAAAAADTEDSSIDKTEEASDKAEAAAAETASDTAADAKAEETAPAPAAENGDTIIQSVENTAGSGKIRQLPSAGQSGSKQEAPTTSSVLTDTTKRPDSYTGLSVMFIETTPVAEKKVAYKDDSFPSTQEDVQQLLKDLASYWSSYNLDAVDYLVRMEKYRYLSQLLAGTADCFYYGDTNAEGVPNGKGIAVYAGNQYYYGDFVNGKRSGKGHWYQIFNRKGDYAKANNGIYLHTYNGEWKNDKPDGQGQEHISLDDEFITTRICTNVIGTFKEGYYDGEEKVTSIDQNGEFINWTGYCIKGAWAPIDGNVIQGYNNKNQIPVLRNAENRDDYFWMMQEENGGQGVMGLVGR